MANKFIISGGNLKIGNVAFHSDLAINHKETVGGGYWELDEDAGVMYLFGRSVDFGGIQRATLIDTIQNGLLPTHMKALKFFHSFSEDFENAKKDKEGIWIEVQ